MSRFQCACALVALGLTACSSTQAGRPVATGAHFKAVSTAAPSLGAEPVLRHALPTDSKYVQFVNAEGSAVGTAVVTQEGSEVVIEADFEGIPGGPFMVSVHEIAACDPPDYTTAGTELRTSPAPRVSSTANYSPTHSSVRTNYFTLSDLDVGRAIVIRQDAPPSRPGQIPSFGEKGPAVGCGLIS